MYVGRRRLTGYYALVTSIDGDRRTLDFAVGRPHDEFATSSPRWRRAVGGGNRHRNTKAPLRNTSSFRSADRTMAERYGFIPTTPFATGFSTGCELSWRSMRTRRSGDELGPTCSSCSAPARLACRLGWRLAEKGTARYRARARTSPWVAMGQDAAVGAAYGVDFGPHTFPHPRDRREPRGSISTIKPFFR